jgi:viroplasmin and RNaseH domain-containing protein
MAKWYVVYSGRVPGVCEEWEDCQAQVTNFSDNCYKGYKTRELVVSKWRRHM